MGHLAKKCNFIGAKDKESPKETAILINTHSILLMASKKDKSNKWILDSACTSNLTNDHQNFVSFTACRGVLKLELMRLFRHSGLEMLRLWLQWEGSIIVLH